MKTSIDLVMFDLDGTLADTGRDLADAVNFTRAHLNLPTLPDAAVLVHVGRGVEHLLKQAIPEESARRFAEVLRIFLERYENHLLDATVLYPGVSETLEYFHNKRRAVVSNKLHRLAVAVLRGLGIGNCFDIILGGDSGPQKKPHPAPLKQALARFHVVPERALMIGDGGIDIQAGKQAGVLTCGVTYGLGHREDVIAAEPDFIVNHLSEICLYFC
jgi:2-phosphoglycolate phosphatase